MNDSQNTALAENVDAIEAISALKSFKNLMFIVAFIALLLLQGAFWMNYMNIIDKTDCPFSEKQAVPAETAQATPSGENAIISLAAQATSEEQTTEVPADTSETASGCGGCGDLFDVDAIIAGLKNPTCDQVACGIDICNFVLFIAVILYSLTLLISLKISIVARLGGINHIARAFLLSLFMLILTIPWQVCFGDIVAGAIYTPGELLSTRIISCDGHLNDCIFYFGRFTGLWAIVIVMLIAAQIRSARWTKEVKRRLGIIKQA